MKRDIPGGYCGGVPPLPIPNREVKPACADGTAMQCGRVGGRLLFEYILLGVPEALMLPGRLFSCPWGNMGRKAHMDVRCTVRRVPAAVEGVIRRQPRPFRKSRRKRKARDMAGTPWRIGFGEKE